MTFFQKQQEQNVPLSAPQRRLVLSDGFTPLEAERLAACREDERWLILANAGFNAPRELLTGFTIIEILISVAVLVILATIISSGFSSFRESSELIQSADSVVEVIKLARAQTLASQDDARYGVHFASSSVVLFKGATFAANPGSHATTTFSARVEVSNVAVTGSAADVVFLRLTGETTNAGTVTLRLITNTAKTKTVQIYASGLFKIQ